MSERHASNAIAVLFALGERGYYVRAERNEATGIVEVAVTLDGGALSGIVGSARGFTLADALQQLAARLP